MFFELYFVRQAYTQVLAHELKKVVRMLRAFPVERLDVRELGCTETARDLALGFVEHVRRIDEIAYGHAATAARPGLHTRGEILLELETAYLGAHAALETLPATRWSELVDAPAGLSMLRHARRGELLWLALRQLIKHDRHFALHMRGVTHGDGGGTRREPVTEPVPAELAIGA